MCCGAYNVAEVGCVMDIEELKRLAFEYKSRPDLQVNEVAFRNAANPAAILELIRQMECLEYAAEANKTLLLESRQNDYQAMAWLAECRFAVGDDGKRMLPEFVEHLKSLKRQRDELLAALRGMVQLDIENHQRGDGDIDIAQEVQAAYNAIANAEESQ